MDSFFIDYPLTICYNIIVEVYMGYYDNTYGIHKVYKITNLLTGKVYIGQTIKRIELRWSHHKSDANKCQTYIHRAILKHGHNNFKIEWIASAFNKEDLDWLEEYLIKDYNSISPNGYNIKNGGSSTQFTKEHKQIMSEAQLKRYKKMTKDEKRKQTSHLRLYTKTIEKPITAINLTTKDIIHFNSITELIKAGFSHSQVYKSLKYYGTSKGYYFFYTNNHTINDMFKLAIQQEADIKKSKKDSRKKAMISMKDHIDSQKIPYIAISPKTFEYIIFESFSQATTNGFNSDAIRRGNRGEKRTSKGYHFQKYTKSIEFHINITKTLFNS